MQKHGCRLGTAEGGACHPSLCGMQGGKGREGKDVRLSEHLLCARASCVGSRRRPLVRARDQVRQAPEKCGAAQLEGAASLRTLENRCGRRAQTDEQGMAEIQASSPCSSDKDPTPASQRLPVVP